MSIEVPTRIASARVAQLNFGLVLGVDMQRPIFIAVLIMFAAALSAAQPTNTTNLPQAIQALETTIQGKSPDDVRSEIIRRFGANQRNVGSGIRIEVWDLPEGRLRFHPLAGPTFEDAKSGRNHWLLRTKNPVASNLLRSYEMFTLADPALHGSQYWLGNLQLGTDSSYRFTDSGQFPEQRAALTANFFMLNPTGSVQVDYPHPVTADTLLESLAEGASVARLTFISADRRHAVTYSVTNAANDRSLTFASGQPLDFAMTAVWKNQWR